MSGVWSTLPRDCEVCSFAYHSCADHPVTIGSASAHPLECPRGDYAIMMQRFNETSCEALRVAGHNRGQ